jgi:hypothetical protein
MTRLPTFLLHKASDRLRSLPETQLLVRGVVLSLAWEVLQSPFYADTFAASWITLAYNRLHCTGGDALILLVAFWLAALCWGRAWMETDKWAPGMAFVMLGLAYTAMSEHFNVHLVQRWAYSRWMPTLGSIGLLPLLQWVIIPTLSVQLVRRHAQPQRQQVSTRSAMTRGTSSRGGK